MKKEKTPLANYESIEMLNGMLHKADSFAQHLDIQANILIGINLAIFLFSISLYRDNVDELFFLVLAIVTGISTLVSILAIHPPRFMRKRGQRESLFYNKKVAEFESSKKYIKAVQEIIKNRDNVTQEYLLEIYNVYKYYYRPKRKLFNLARNILIIGIYFCALLFILSFS